MTFTDTKGYFFDVLGTVTMNSGTFTGSKGADGGAVHVGKSGSFIMNGGTISGNTGTYGGAVHVENTGLFTMNGGSISNNTASSAGGGLLVNGEFIMNGGAISGNKAADQGGGIYIDSKGKITLNAGELYNNTATARYGGAIGTGTAPQTAGNRVYNAVIVGNSANKSESRGGGIWSCPSGIVSFEEASTIIGGNTALKRGAQISIESSKRPVIPTKMLGGADYQWYWDMEGKRYPGTNTAFNSDVSPADYDNSGINLTNTTQISATDLASLKAEFPSGKVFIYNNTAGCGGGVGGNGSISFIKGDDPVPPPPAPVEAALYLFNYDEKGYITPGAAPGGDIIDGCTYELSGANAGLAEIYTIANDDLNVQNVNGVLSFNTIEIANGSAQAFDHIPKLVFNKEGTYTLVETVIKSGYEGYENIYTIVVDADSVVTITEVNNSLGQHMPDGDVSSVSALTPEAEYWWCKSEAGESTKDYYLKVKHQLEKEQPAPIHPSLYLFNYDENGYVNPASVPGGTVLAGCRYDLTGPKASTVTITSGTGNINVTDTANGKTFTALASTNGAGLDSIPKMTFAEAGTYYLTKTQELNGYIESEIIYTIIVSDSGTIAISGMKPTGAAIGQQLPDGGVTSAAQLTPGSEYWWFKAYPDANNHDYFLKVKHEKELLPPTKAYDLGWMRSSELQQFSFLLPVGNGTPWTYEQAFRSTQIQYFENTDVQTKANEKAAAGTEVVRPLDEQKVGLRYIWDKGDYFDLYKEQNGNVTYDWASWKHWGESGNTVDKGEYSIRRFSAYFDVSASDLNTTESAFIAPIDELGNMSTVFPVNDNVFVFINGQLAYWGGTDVIDGNNQYGALNRTEFMGKQGVPVRNGVNGNFKDIYPHTDGWVIDLDLNRDQVNIKDYLQPGFNRIDIFTDEYWEGGGMNRLKLYTNTTAPAQPAPVSSL